jgi:hypothetical protein
MPAKKLRQEKDRNTSNEVGFEILTAVTMKSSTLLSSGNEIAACFMLALLLGLLFDLEHESIIFLRKVS